MSNPLAFTVKTTDDIDLFVDVWTRQANLDDAKRTIVVIHGYGEHGGRYRHLKEDFLRFFDAVFLIDLRGHGRSGGVRGHCQNMAQIHQDIETVFHEILKKVPHSKFDLFCHSLGGLIGITLLQKWAHDKSELVTIEKAAFSAPLLEVAMPIPAVLRGAAMVLNFTLSKLQLWSEINPMHLSHDPKMTEAYLKDSLVHSKITPRMFFSLEDAMMSARKNDAALPCPVLFMIAGDDKIVSSQAIRDYVSNLKQDSKKSVEFEGMYHELVNELDRKKVIDTMMSWYKGEL